MQIFDLERNMNYTDALNYIHGTLKFGVKLGLTNICDLLELMGNPHKKLKFVHVAGTNGKGSTVSFISSILINSGYKTGMYTSPFIERFTERIRINNEEILQDELARIAEYVKNKVELLIESGGTHPTEFEIVTAIAMQYFYEKNCDVVVLEVGLGGRYDSTNVIDTPLVSVITTINYDHTDRLGDTLEKIAYEKAGIIKQCGDVVLYPQIESVEQVFDQVADSMDAKVLKLMTVDTRVIHTDIWGTEFSYKNKGNFKIRISGEHQAQNASVAIETAYIIMDKGFDKITHETIKKGLFEAKWPGRLEVINKKPLFIIDGAHNSEGAMKLYQNLNKYFYQKKIIFIVGVLKDKDYKAIIEPVLSIAREFIIVEPKSDRALPANELGKFVSRYCKDVTISDTIDNAVKHSLEKASEDSIICAFGSLYYIGEVRRLLMDNGGDIIV